MHQINLWDSRIKELSQFAARIATLVQRYKAKRDDPAVAALDDLLGSVYALVSAVEKDFKGKSGKSDFDAVVIRSQQLAHGQVRRDGNWMAGFHFNNALFRISAVFDRLPKALGGHAAARQAYAKRKRRAWQDKEAHDIRDEVNDLKHKASGVFRKRRRVLESERFGYTHTIRQVMHSSMSRSVGVGAGMRTSLAALSGGMCPTCDHTTRRHKLFRVWQNGEVSSLTRSSMRRYEFSTIIRGGTNLGLIP